ncbi:MAG: 1-acyl-sn-glycerol-3-phosphate acyltransferase [Rhodoferax sp.]
MPEHASLKPPHPVQLVGSPLARRVLGAMGWSLHFDGLPTLQGVFVVYPHTSNWDFVYAVMAKWALGVQLNFWAKDTLFKVPLLGRWIRWLGGIPTVRNAPGGLVGQAVAELQAARREERYCWLGLSPEGTRKRTAGWRSGFYQTALQAGVPLCLVRLDFGRKELVATHFFQLSGDRVADMAVIAESFAGARGFRPDGASPVVLLASTPQSGASSPRSSGASPHA